MNSLAVEMNSQRATAIGLKLSKLKGTTSLTKNHFPVCQLQSLLKFKFVECKEKSELSSYACLCTSPRGKYLLTTIKGMMDIGDIHQ